MKEFDFIRLAENRADCELLLRIMDEQGENWSEPILRAVEEFRPVKGYDGLYEISADGRLFAVERTVFQDDSTGRRFFKTIKRHEKVQTTNARGYPAFNLHKDNRQTCRLVRVLVEEAWGPQGTDQ